MFEMISRNSRHRYHSRHGLHTPRFTIDERAMETGTALLAALAVRSGEP